MDPNANLREQGETKDSWTLCKLRHALRDWLARGGFEPTWSAYPAAAKDFKAWMRRAAKFQDLAR